MDLMTNATFRIVKELNSTTKYLPGIYRIILDQVQAQTTIAVLIWPEDRVAPKKRTGRPPTPTEKLRRPRKKPPQPLVGEMIWMDRRELERLSEVGFLTMITVEQEPAPEISGRTKAEYERRTLTMASFLDVKTLHQSIIAHGGLGVLVRNAITTTKVSRCHVYKNWSALCRWGLTEKSLIPRWNRCGAPGIKRPCDPSADAKPTRQKAGRKTAMQKVALAYGSKLDPEQPGMSSEWAAAIRAADNQIQTPKPSWSRRIALITSSAFCARVKEEDGHATLVKPDKGTYPNDAQIRRVLTVDQTRLERLIERTTKRFFRMALRGLVARNWKDVAGPGHTWAIDSTVGDIFLRSSVNRAWIVGRPIVYIIVDIWSTAIVGFYVCLCGPSWNTAKVSLFNAAADPTLIADLWGYQSIRCLEPAPTMCYSLMCDRGEYLSQAHRTTALKLLPLTSYAPPYRGDLKGLVEVLHRIEKDAQFLFIPGAMDYRRKELELRKVNPESCVFTVREYVYYLHELFSNYNLTANREHRVDAHMQAAGVFASPAGLWHWGHAMGVGFRRHILESDLITQLLPSDTGRVCRDAVRYAGCDYLSDEVTDLQWTAIARNHGGWNIPINYYPGSMRTIWTPGSSGSDLLRLHINDQSLASPELTREEWADALALKAMKRPDEQHQRNIDGLGALERIKTLRANAEHETQAAISKASGSVPTMTDARAIELAATIHPLSSESKVIEGLREDAMQEHDDMMAAILSATDQMEAADDAA